MATANDLLEAAQQTYQWLTPLAASGGLRAALLPFCVEVLTAFPQALAAGHPVANWAAVIYAFATDMAATANDWSLLRIAADYVYRICFMGLELEPLLPTEAQALLDAYNNNF